MSREVLKRTVGYDAGGADVPHRGVHAILRAGINGRVPLLTLFGRWVWCGTYIAQDVTYAPPARS